MCNEVAIVDIATMGDGHPVAVTGQLRALQLKRTAAGEDWATMVLADEGGTVTVLVLVRTFATVDKNTLSPATLVWVWGRVYRSDDGALRIVASHVGLAPGRAAVATGAD